MNNILGLNQYIQFLYILCLLRHCIIYTIELFINIIVYPFDSFYLTDLDDLASIISIGMPIIFINVSLYEQILIFYIYITSSYLSHSELYWSHHSIHHKLLNCNYCILFPIFDIIFGTYRRCKKITGVKKNTSVNSIQV